MMNIFNFQQRSESSAPASNFFHQTFSNLQTHIDSAIFNLQSNTKLAIETGFLTLSLVSKSSPKQDIIWARIGDKRGDGGGRRTRRSSLAMSDEVIEKRLGGVPVYALCNSSSEFVFITGESSGKSLGLFCIKEENADALLQHMKAVDDDFHPGTRIVPVSLSKVIQLKADGIAFRLLPDPSQVKNALEERQKAGLSNLGFSGVPVFQSNSLMLKFQDKEYRPVFLRKEDLEKSVKTAADKQLQNPASRKESIEVAVLEDVIKEMKVIEKEDWKVGSAAKEVYNRMFDNFKEKSTDLIDFLMREIRLATSSWSGTDPTWNGKQAVRT